MHFHDLKNHRLQNLQRLSAIVDSQIRASQLPPIDEIWVEWIKDLQSAGYSFFKFDLTFSSSGSRNEKKWNDYFNSKVVYKIEKVLRPK